jgi:transcriptional regulatory protein LevR
VLGRDYVACLDVPDNLSDEALTHVIEARLDEMDRYSSILVLTDSERLMNLCTELAKTRTTPLYVMGDVNTSMVIEATLLMDEKHADAQQVHRHLVSMKNSYRELSVRESARLAVGAPRHTIVAACISGCGVAVRLKQMIEDSFELSPEVDIVTMDIPSVGELRDRLTALAAERDILCVVGMDVGLETAYPFISVDEFVLGSGIQRLSSILSSFQIYHRLQSAPAPQNGDFYEDAFYSGKYLDGYLFFLSGDKLMPYLRQACAAIEASRGEMRQGKRIMLAIHLASMVERILFDGTAPAVPAARSAEDLVRALTPLASVYRITISDEEYDMIEQILSLVLNK